jgi:preprotein translocase subunit SecA
MLALAEDLVDDLVDRYAGKDMDSEEWDIAALEREVNRVFGFDAEEFADLKTDEKNTEEIANAIWDRAKASYEEKEQMVGADLLRRVERDIMLQIVDTQWKDHLYSLDHLKEGIGLRGYGQRDPLVEYKKESFALFQDMKARIEEEIVRYLFWLRPVLNDEAPVVPKPAPRRATPITLSKPEAAPALVGARAAAPSGVPAEFGGGGGAPQPARTGGDDIIKTVRREEPKVGRNDPCPCGSGKKYKKCHGAGA